MPLDLSPRPIVLPVPSAYKDYVARKWNSEVLITLLPSFLALVVFVTDGFRVKSFAMWHVSLIPICGAIWFYQKRKPWHYNVGKRGIALIYYSRSFWSWRHVFWKEEVVLSIQPTSWQNLPALSFRVVSRLIQMEHMEVLLMVYRPEDEDVVRDRVMPAIEYYRQKYGHDQWIADHGWESYITPAKVMVDG